MLMRTCQTPGAASALCSFVAGGTGGFHVYFAVDKAVVQRAGLRDFAVVIFRVAIPDNPHGIAGAVEIGFG